MADQSMQEDNALCATHTLKYCLLPPKALFIFQYLNDFFKTPSYIQPTVKQGLTTKLTTRTPQILPDTFRSFHTFDQT